MPNTRWSQATEDQEWEGEPAITPRVPSATPTTSAPARNRGVETRAPERRAPAFALPPARPEPRVSEPLGFNLFPSPAEVWGDSPAAPLPPPSTS